MGKNWGLKRKFVTVFGIWITLPTIFFGIFIYFQTTQALKDQAIEEAVERLERNEQSLLSIISTVESMSSYMIYDKDFRKFFKTPERESHGSEYTLAIDGIRGYFTFQQISNEYINSILLVSKDGQTLEHGEPVTGNEKHLYRSAQLEKGHPVWSGSYPVRSEWDGKKYVISMSRVINDINTIDVPIGMVRIRLDQAKLYHTIEQPSKQGEYLVLSEKGDTVIHNDSSLIGKPYPDSELVEWIAKGKAQSYHYEKDGTNYLVTKKRIQGTNWLSVMIIDENKLVGELYSVRASIVLLITLLILLGTVAFIGFYQTIIRPIIALTQQTRQVEIGNFTASVQVNSKDEIGKLGMRFNRMVRKIQRHIDTEYKLKIKQNESELKALQSQIDPHFLYNTLDMIRWTARLENAMETSQQIERLSKIFRMNLNNGKLWVTVEEELEYIENYLELQKSRLGDRLDFQLIIDDQIRESYILKQILQPFVENSIRHGFKDLPRTGIITIRGYAVNGQVWIDIIDNGWGFVKKNPAKQSQQHAGFALNNLKERLNILFGEPYGLNILDAKAGTVVRLILPFLDDTILQRMKKELGE